MSDTPLSDITAARAAFMRKNGHAPSKIIMSVADARDLFKFLEQFDETSVHTRALTLFSEMTDEQLVDYVNNGPPIEAYGMRLMLTLTGTTFCALQHDY